MYTITKKDYEKFSNDIRGVWDTERWDIPGWDDIREKYIGKRTLLVGTSTGGVELLIEGLSLNITDEI